MQGNEQINLFVPGRAMSETRKPSSPHWNAFPEAAGLELTAPQGMRAGGAFGLNAELIFGQQPLSGEGVSFRLGVKTGRLLLDLQGCAVVPGTRFAMHDQPAAVLRQEKIEEIAIDTRKVEISGEAMLDFSGNDLKGQNKIGGQLSAQRTKVRKHTQEITEEIHKVVAHGSSIEPSWEKAYPFNSGESTCGRRRGRG